VSGARLPRAVRDLFWDLDSRALRLDRDREQIIGRVLSHGPWDTVQWLRKQVGDEAVRDWILRHQGRGLSPQQLRFWEAILALPHHPVSEWVRAARESVWGQRSTP
jgi:hypothetical protein